MDIFEQLKSTAEARGWEIFYDRSLKMWTFTHANKDTEYYTQEFLLRRFTSAKEFGQWLDQL